MFKYIAVNNEVLGAIQQIKISRTMVSTEIFRLAVSCCTHRV